MSGPLASLHSIINLGTSSYSRYGLQTETDLIAKTSWSDILRQARRDAGAGFRDLTSYFTGSRSNGGDSNSVIKFIDSAVAARNRSRATAAMGTDKLYNMSTLVPGGASLFYFMNLLMNVYDKDEAAEPGVLFKKLGIEVPIATALDDRLEKMFMLYIYSSIERDAEAIPRPYEGNKTDRLSRKWRLWIRKKLDRFLCSAIHVRINATEGKCGK